MSINIAGLWRQGRELAERHAGTTVPVAAAFLFLPQVVRMAIEGPAAQPGEVTGGNALASLVVATLAFVGQVAIASIMLGGHGGPQTVGDAIRQAVGLLPRVMLMLLMFLAALLPLVFVLGLVLVILSGGTATDNPQALARSAGVLFIPVLAIFAYFGARLFLLFPVLVAETPPAWQTIQRSWLLTRPHRWVLVGFMGSALLAILFLTTLVNMVAGGIFGLVLGPQSGLGQLITVSLATLAGTAVGLIIIGASVAAYQNVARCPS